MTQALSATPKLKQPNYPIGLPKPQKPTVEQLKDWELAQITIIKEDGYNIEKDEIIYKRKNIEIVIHRKWNRKQIQDEVDKEPSNWAYNIAQVYRPSQASGCDEDS